MVYLHAALAMQTLIEKRFLVKAVQNTTLSNYELTLKDKLAPETAINGVMQMGRCWSTCDVLECGNAQALHSTAQTGNYTPEICKDTKTYVHCLVKELKGCVGLSKNRRTLQTLANVFYDHVILSCEYFGDNGICDIADCVYVADVSKGYAPVQCQKLKTYVKCMDIEYRECGKRTIFGSLINSELYTKRQDLYVYCGGAECYKGIPVMTITFVILVTYIIT